MMTAEGYGYGVRCVVIDADDITNWVQFHSIFQRQLGFPSFYGANMDAWIDCLTCLDDADAGLSNVTLKQAEVLMLEISNVRPFRERCREIHDALIECAAFVNGRRVKGGGRPVLALLLID